MIFLERVAGSSLPASGRESKVFVTNRFALRQTQPNPLGSIPALHSANAKTVHTHRGSGRFSCWSVERETLIRALRALIHGDVSAAHFVAELLVCRKHCEPHRVRFQ